VVQTREARSLRCTLPAAARSVVGGAGVLLAVATAAFAGPQAGDNQNEVQAELPPELIVPAAPALSPEQALSSFRAQRGLRVELVAAEPLVVAPVVATFDGEGRLWVCEMRGYMPDVDGEGEGAASGVIAVLEDTDGDGRMDRRTPFLEELVLPRAVLPVEDGALVIVPPALVFARDIDGDGRADELETIAEGMGGIHSPEHAQNGITFTHRNWFRLANASFELRREEGLWVQRRTAGGGQWGLAQDDLGRIFFDTNPDPLRGDRYPSHYSVRNPNHGLASGVNVRFAHDMELFPVRMNPGVNRGYREGLLRDDYTLSRFTAACSPLIYRGDLLPVEFRGDAFVCEPAGNLVKRFHFERAGRELDAVPVDADGEFLVSTDERFRPVHLMDGPDGALYVVDMYRGVIQHRIFVTSFLRKQIEERGLETPLGLGRIWRVVPTDDEPEPRWKSEEHAPLSERTWTQLVSALSSSNGWRRDRAHQVLVEEGRNEADAIELLREAVRSSSPQGRRHALWCLQGIAAIDQETCEVALADEHESVRVAAVQVSEAFLSDPALVRKLVGIALAADSKSRLRHQVLLSLGAAQGEPADRALIAILTPHADDEELLQAALSSLYQRELEVLGKLAVSPEWRDEKPGRARLLTLLARAIVREGRSERIERMLQLAAGVLPWQLAGIRAGLEEACPKSPEGEPTPLLLGACPAALEDLPAGSPLEELAGLFVWPGKPGYREREPVPPLSAEEERLFQRGKTLYAAACAQCHRSSGRGDPGKAPTLRRTRFVLGPPERLTRILMQGLAGPVEVEGRTWDAEMPALVAGDEDLAAVATYLRREWGNGADPVPVELVERVRQETRGRVQPWRALELEALGVDPLHH